MGSASGICAGAVEVPNQRQYANNAQLNSLRPRTAIKNLGRFPPTASTLCRAVQAAGDMIGTLLPT